MFLTSVMKKLDFLMLDLHLLSPRFQKKNYTLTCSGADIDLVIYMCHFEDIMDEKVGFFNVGSSSPICPSSKIV